MYSTSLSYPYEIEIADAAHEEHPPEVLEFEA